MPNTAFADHPDWDHLDAADDAEVKTLNVTKVTATTVTSETFNLAQSEAAANMKASAENAEAARAWERWVDARPWSRAEWGA